MRTFKVSDELYEQLKSFVVDPFDDSPETVIGRLVEIVNKAKSRWSPFEEPQPPDEGSYSTAPPRRRDSRQFKEEEVIL